MHSLKFWYRFRYYLWCVLAGIASVVVGFEMYAIVATAAGNIHGSITWRRVSMFPAGHDTNHVV